MFGPSMTPSPCNSPPHLHRRAARRRTGGSAGLPAFRRGGNRRSAGLCDLESATALRASHSIGACAEQELDAAAPACRYFISTAAIPRVCRWEILCSKATRSTCTMRRPGLARTEVGQLSTPTPTRASSSVWRTFKAFAPTPSPYLLARPRRRSSPEKLPAVCVAVCVCCERNCQVRCAAEAVRAPGRA